LLPAASFSASKRGSFDLAVCRDRSRRSSGVKRETSARSRAMIGVPLSSPWNSPICHWRASRARADHGFAPARSSSSPHCAFAVRAASNW
jgi:hypothetical protein